MAFRSCVCVRERETRLVIDVCEAEVEVMIMSIRVKTVKMRSMQDDDEYRVIPRPKVKVVKSERTDYLNLVVLVPFGLELLYITLL